MEPVVNTDYCLVSNKEVGNVLVNDFLIFALFKIKIQKTN